MSTHELEGLLAEAIQRHNEFRLIVNKEQSVYELRSPVEFPGLTWFWILYIHTDGKQVLGKAVRPLDGNFYSCLAPPDEGILPVSMEVKKDTSCVAY